MKAVKPIQMYAHKMNATYIVKPLNAYSGFSLCNIELAVHLQLLSVFRKIITKNLYMCKIKKNIVFVNSSECTVNIQTMYS